MDTQLSEQIQAALDALALAQNEAARVRLAMRKQRVYFGLAYGHVDDDIAQVISKLRYVQLLAERTERAEAEMLIIDATERITTPD